MYGNMVTATTEAQGDGVKAASQKELDSNSNSIESGILFVRARSMQEGHLHILKIP
jgi:hypothetical protein